MPGRLKALLVIGVILIGIYIFKPLYTVDEIEQAVVLEWGVNPVKAVKEAGFHFKWPWPYQNIVKFDDRLLKYEAQSREIITRDKKTLLLDNYARWRINDPIKFLQTVKNEEFAQARIDDIIYSELRVETANHDQIDIIAQERENITRKVTVRCNEKAKEYGLEIVDVRIKRADFPKENEQSVFQRMVAERERQAKKYRSEGQSEATSIRAEADKESTIIVSEAYKESQRMKGDGDAEAVRIYGEAYMKDPNFYSFLRTLETYEKSLTGKTTAVFSTDSEVFRLLEHKDLTK